MSNFGIGYLVTSVAFSLLVLFLGVQSLKKRNPLGRRMAVACFSCVVMMLSYLVTVFCTSRFVFSAFTSINFISIDVLVLALLSVVFLLSGLGGKKWSRLYFMAALACACIDAVVYLVNPVTEIAITFVSQDTNISKYKLCYKLPHYLHLAFCYSIVLVIFACLSHKAILTPRNQNGRYLFALLGLVAVVFINAIIIFRPEFSVYSIIDFSLLGFCMVTYLVYRCCFYRSSRDYLYNHSIPLEKRMNVLFINTAVVGTICGLTICLAASVNFVGVATVACLIVCLLGFSVLIRNSNYGEASLWIPVSVILVAMPVIWIFSGGVDSGVNSWFVYEFIYFSFVLKGRKLFAALGIALLLDGLAYYFGYLYPEWVYTLTSREAIYISTVSSTFTVGFIVVSTVVYQKNIYYDEQLVLERSNKEQERLRKIAVEANRAKSDFLASMSHDIRTPINAVLGMDEMILRGGTPDEIMDYARNIKQSGNMLLSIVSDILDFSKIESGKMEIIPAEYSVSSLFNDLIAVTTPGCKSKGLSLKTEIAEDIPSVLFGDDVRIRQVVSNLLSNAVKYTQEGYVLLRVQNSWNNDKVILHVEVQDTGVGIRDEDRAKLFDSFRRLDEVKNRSVEGSGLGLSITAKLLGLMDSGLRVESSYGVGSRFSFDLVQEVVDKTPVGNIQKRFAENLAKFEVYHEGFEAPQAKILVVDDNKMNLMVVKGLLKNSKMQIDTAESGRECLARTWENSYHIIFMDHMMPGMDGEETLKTFKALPHNPSAGARVVSLTANAVAGAREMYLSMGFDDFLPKPIQGKALEQCILKFLPPELVKMKSPQGLPVKKCENTEFVPKEQLIDSKKGLALCRNDVDFYKELLSALSQEDFAVQLQEYYERKDWENYRVKIHALKSCLASVGADKTSLWAKKLETATANGEFHLVHEEHSLLLKELAAVLVAAEELHRDFC